MKILPFYHFIFIFTLTPPNIKDWKDTFSKLVIIPIYEGAHLVKTSNLALLSILAQLVQKSNKNVSVKHPI